MEHNRLTRHVIGARTVVLKVYGEKPRTFKFYKYRVLARLGLNVPVEYRLPIERRRFEVDVYRRWRECGYNVAAVFDDLDVGSCVSPDDIWLALEYIEGPTLGEYLRDPAHSMERRIDLLENIFHDNRQRHERCLEEADYRLVHFDSNLRNILLQHGSPVHIDFEMGRSNEPLTRSITRETLKLALEAANLLGSAALDPIAGIVRKYYDNLGVVKGIIKDARAASSAKRTRKSTGTGRISRFEFAEALID